MPLPIRLMCVDDHRIVREGITLILQREPDFDVVASAATAREAINAFRLHRPDVTLMDLQLPGVSGLEAIAEIRDDFPDAKIIVLTMYQGDEDIFRALEAGAITYLLKDTLSDDLIRVVRDVYSGTHQVTAEIEQRLATRAANPTLTRREIQVLEFVSQGLRNKEIATACGISEDTVQVHIRSMFRKLNVHDRTAAVRVALRRGIVHVT